MKTLLSLSFFMLAFSTGIYSQQFSDSHLMDFQLKNIEDFYSNTTIKTNIEQNDKYLSNVKGSPYLVDEFKNGDIVTTSNTKYIGIPLRYNAYNNEFEDPNKNAYNLEKSTIKNLQIGDTQFIYKAYVINKNIAGRSYFEVLLSGKADLLKQYHVRFEPEKAPAAYADPIPARFSPEKADYYILFGDEAAQRIDNTKELLSCIPDKKEEIEKFIKSNKLRMSNEKDVIKIIEFYNSSEK